MFSFQLNVSFKLNANYIIDSKQHIPGHSLWWGPKTVDKGLLHFIGSGPLVPSPGMTGLLIGQNAVSALHPPGD